MGHVSFFWRIHAFIHSFIHSFSQSFYKEAVVKLPVETSGGRRR